MTDDILFPDPSKGAEFSRDGTYRYMLYRKWDPSRESLGWLMLNPSIADSTENDPTIRRCIDFAQTFGYGGIAVANLYALRSTDPGGLWAHSEPIGELNDDWITEVGEGCGKHLVAAWGVAGGPRIKQRVARVKDVCTTRGIALSCLGRTKDGSPRHPLFVLRTAKLEEYK